jgi:hypothetical protein
MIQHYSSKSVKNDSMNHLQSSMAEHSLSTHGTFITKEVGKQNALLIIHHLISS